MKTNFLGMWVTIVALFVAFSCNAHEEELTASDTMIIDHTCTDIFSVPLEYINSAKEKLVIAYGHTSHGSQLITGMYGLDYFMIGHNYPEGTFNYNSDGSNNAIELHDCAFENYGASDLGNPDRVEWASATRKYLADHTNVNVVMWSWCGQAAWASTEEIDQYLSLMTGLENDFPAVRFVYMTGHLDGTGKEGQLNQNNERIRSYCKTNHKILFDFADIESYDPDGKVNYMELYCNDNCDYTSATGESHNWATDWQNSHTKKVDWFDCEPAHTQALNGNRKAYAAWWMFARIAGWDSDGISSTVVNLENDNRYNWNITGNSLHISMINQQTIDRVELYDLNGKILYTGNRIENGTNIVVPLSGAAFQQGKTVIFRIVSGGKSYSDHFIVKTL